MTLEEIAKKMCAKGKGILAADESNVTMTKRLNSVGVESTNNSATNNKNYKDIDDLDDELEEDESGVEKNKLKMYFGVFPPCMLNIFGAILFLRLPS